MNKELSVRAVSGEVRNKDRMGFRDICAELCKHKLLYGMMIPSLLWVIVFCYIPMVGVIIAFKDFNMMDGIFGSPWAGFKNFEFLFRHKNIGRIVFNTLYLNILFLIFNTSLSVFFALMFSEIKNKLFKKITQSIAILPHFISWAVVSMFLIGFLSNNGIINGIMASLGGETIYFYSDPGPWRIILVILKAWSGVGFGTVIYVAAITGFDTSMYEAATIDGANRIQKITRITLPMLKPTIILLTIMGIGGIFRGDLGMIYALIQDNSLLFPTIDVVDTFVFRALRQANDLGMSTATGLLQSIIGLIMVFATNALVRKIEPDSALF